jgi:sodium-coupled monocarboxylate transporter 8/12
MSAVVYGDAIQMVLILLGTLTCLAAGFYHLGGIDNFVANVDSARLHAVDFSSFGFNGEGFGFAPMLVDRCNPRRRDVFGELDRQFSRRGNG